jgi:hypothetical protein
MVPVKEMDMTNEMQQWIEQAKAAIKQGQGENDFVAHCHPDNRATARKAYRKAAAAATHSFWVIERFENGRSAGYWDGANSRSFQPEIDKAIQFRRKEDAFWATRGWHWNDVQLTEHLYICAAEPSSCASLLAEALELIQEDIDNRDGRDNFDMSCGNCEGAIPVKHSFGCRARQAIADGIKAAR